MFKYLFQTDSESQICLRFKYYHTEFTLKREYNQSLSDTLVYRENEKKYEFWFERNTKLFAYIINIPENDLLNYAIIDAMFDSNNFPWYNYSFLLNVDLKSSTGIYLLNSSVGSLKNKYGEYIGDLILEKNPEDNTAREIVFKTTNEKYKNMKGSFILILTKKHLSFFSQELVKSDEILCIGTTSRVLLFGEYLTNEERSTTGPKKETKRSKNSRSLLDETEKQESYEIMKKVLLFFIVLLVVGFFYLVKFLSNYKRIDEEFVDEKL